MRNPTVKNKTKSEKLEIQKQTKNANFSILRNLVYKVKLINTMKTNIFA